MSHKPTVLYICHNHPSVRPGGAEAYALELFQGVRDQGQFEPIFVAKGGPPYSSNRQPHPGTQFGRVDGEPNQYFVYTDGYDFNWLFGSMNDKEFYTKHFHAFLKAHRPAVVHFQHTLFLGYDLIREVRNALPDVPIVYTLHEYLPICHRQGQMVRAVNSEELCDHESPRRCHECFPHVSPQTFFLRKRFIQSHFSLVDLFIAPCRFLRERFIAWGLPADKIRVEEYGRQPIVPLPEGDKELGIRDWGLGIGNGREAGAPPAPSPSTRRNRFGYFGQLTPFKGSQVVFNAVKILVDGEKGVRNRLPERPAECFAQKAPDTFVAPAALDFQVRMHGANLDFQAESYQNEFRAFLEATRDHVTMIGRYRHEDLPALMAQIDWVIVPSIWWENSPLVIQEAFGFGKPVLCSNIGGMAEKVTDRVDGLHFRVNDPRHLAEIMREAASTPGLWETLRKGIRPPYAMSEHVETLVGIYRELCRSKALAR